MKNRRLPLIALPFLILIVSVAVLAHHGTAAFDMENVTTVKGTVTKFEFMNPHALIYFDVTGNKGEIEHWIAEESSNNHRGHRG